MAEQPTGEKTEQASEKKLNDAFENGQFPRSTEVQTLAVTSGASLALFMGADGIWNDIRLTTEGLFNGLTSIDVDPSVMSSYAKTSAATITGMVGPTVAAATGSALLAGAMQTRFQLTPKVMGLNWAKLSPIAGWKRVVSLNSWVTTGFSLLKFASLAAVLYFEIVNAVRSPVFYSSVSIEQYLSFLTSTTVSMLVKAIVVMLFLALLDYAYRVWKNNKDLMMTKQEVKDELKNADGDPKMKGRRNQMRLAMRQRKMLSDVPFADVIITNPTHLAVALKYEKKSMGAPKILAMGAEHLAARIRQIAGDHQIPIIENKPVARMLYHHAEVGSEIPAALYAAVAEILATVYRLNPYRYYRKQTAGA